MSICIEAWLKCEIHIIWIKRYVHDWIDPFRCGVAQLSHERLTTQLYNNNSILQFFWYLQYVFMFNLWDYVICCVMYDKPDSDIQGI